MKENGENIQPEILVVDEDLRLKKHPKENWKLALPWYSNEKVLLFSEGIKDGRTYDLDTINKMYTYLESIGELFFIEIKEGNRWIPIGDACLSESNTPIVIGDEKHWGKAIGKRVLGALLQRAKQKNMRKISIEIYDYNERSKNLFQSFGFKKMRSQGESGFYELEIE